VDGRFLFRVRGIAAYPPETRAAAIVKRITNLAKDPRMDPAGIQLVESSQSSDVMLNGKLIVSVTDADASLEGIGRRPVAFAYGERAHEAIENYRRERSADYLKRTGLYAAISTVLFAAALWVVIRLTRRLIAIAEARSKHLVRSVAIQSFQIVEAERIGATLRGAFRALRYVLIAALAYGYAQAVLERFPWTRPLARRSLTYIIDPLASVWQGFVAKLPDLIVLAIIVIVVRYVLRLLRLFFEAVGRGSVQLQNFDTAWAAPTYRIARYVLLIFTAVIAYPYIPGSGSEAFKGISLFLGVMLSIGSTSFISNMIAGYALTYRRVLKVGDWIRVDETLGEVIHTRLQVTHLRSPKNEEITIPNSVILNSKVVNYSTLTAERHLILHTQVGIGYEVPWRQVEGLLLLAAQRTAEIQREPPPFVLQKALGDFAVTYELNVYADDPSQMARLYTKVHRSILDVFNEYGVQIMTPAYEGDPEVPKVVPKDRWFDAPAQPAVAETLQTPPAVLAAHAVPRPQFSA
jgi:small-conductance mechanosensitive channel